MYNYNRKEVDMWIYFLPFKSLYVYMYVNKTDSISPYSKYMRRMYILLWN